MTRLDLVVGPNGAGKSTFVDIVLLPTLPHHAFVNADEIAQESFIAETVSSHSSKADLIRESLAAGYLVHLHVLMLPEDDAVARVGKRVSQGGHEVPEERTSTLRSRPSPGRVGPLRAALAGLLAGSVDVDPQAACRQSTKAAPTGVGAALVQEGWLSVG